MNDNSSNNPTHQTDMPPSVDIETEGTSPSNHSDSSTSEPKEASERYEFICLLCDLKLMNKTIAQNHFKGNHEFEWTTR